ncbi:hypothetical protein V490_00281 [Pseudogymnoascus sp. VKM F-3557]|nr:hypothetical protein V490_00281 [Pseudogymnoascus sp. VKM F-3557]
MYVWRRDIIDGITATSALPQVAQLLDRLSYVGLCVVGVCSHIAREIVMSARRATPAGKQRVRTGCLTCRKRRRKCDEQKPRCENCEAKGFSCRYGADLSFVSAPNPEPQQSNEPLNATVKAYSTITFVLNDDTSLVSTPPQRGESILRQHTPARQVDNDSATASVVAIAQESVAGPAPQQGSSSGATSFSRVGVTSYPVRSPLVRNDALEQPIQLNPLNHLINDSRNAPSGHNLDRSHNRTYSDSTLSHRLIDSRGLANGDQEIGLLRHFRYNLAPWIDVGDPESFVGIKTMLLARANRSLLAALLALAARHRSLINHQENSDDLKSSLKFREEAERGLMFEDDHISHIIRVLLILEVLFCSSPLHWRALPFHQMGIPGDLASLSAPGGELCEPLFWLQFKIDLAASIVSAQPLLMPLRSYLLNDCSSGRSFRSLSQRQSAKQIYQHSLFLLADCLSLIFGGQEPSSSRPYYAQLPSSRSLPNSNFSSKWTSLWNDCQKWYNNRSAEVQQILEIRGVEADQIGTHNSPSFPILIYTTPLALVSNAVYHITSLLMLAHKPRLLKRLAGPGCFTSHIWHAQSIAGIATSNDSLEQWDPILVAGLLLVAKEMTHESQQSLVLNQLGRVTAMVGIKLDCEIEALKSGWNISRYDQDSRYRHETVT